MECVADTSAISWLERIGYLELLTQIYQKIWVPPSVQKELEKHVPVTDFMQKYTIPVTVESVKDQKRFERLVRRWQRKVAMKDLADLEVFIAYKYFIEADEALYANKEAEQKLSKYGNVRDVVRLYELAEAKNIFTKENSITFLESFLKCSPPYKPQYISRLLKELR